MTENLEAQASVKQPISDDEREQFWLSHMESWTPSGLSQAEYCRQNDLNIARFRYWKRRFSMKKLLNLSKNQKVAYIELLPWKNRYLNNPGVCHPRRRLIQLSGIHSSHYYEISTPAWQWEELSVIDPSKNEFEWNEKVAIQNKDVNESLKKAGRLLFGSTARPVILRPDCDRLWP